MIQNLFSQDDQNAKAASQPAVSADPSFGEAFSSAYETNNRVNSMWAQTNNENDFVQQHLDMVKARTGEQIPNSYSGEDGFKFQRMQDLRDRTAKQAKMFNDPSLVLPDDDAIAQGGVNLARQSMARSARINEAGGFGAQAGAATAGLVGMASDPITVGATIATAPLGGEGGIAIQSIRMGLIMAAQQAATEAATYNYKGKVDPTRTLSDAAAAVGEAGVGGALFGLGGALGEKSVGHALGSAIGGAVGGGILGGTQGALTGAALPLAGVALGPLWRMLRVENPKIIDNVPQSFSDAGNVAERAADLEANNPFKTGSSGEGAHYEALASVARSMDSGEQMELPTNALREGSVRTGQAFVPRVSDPEPSKAFVGKQVINLKYELAEASDLVTSHDGDFRVNPDYPAEMQPRDRAGIPARDQVMSIAQNLQPERLGPNPEANAGAPIVGPDNVVESGNGRAMAVRSAYDMGDSQSAAYRAWLERSGYDTTGMQNPVLVGRRTSAMTPEERADFAHAANGSASLRMNATEQALSDARHLSPDLVSFHQDGDIGSAANRDFVRAIVGKMPTGERGGMMDARGNLSSNGVKRLNAAMVARAFGDPDVISRAFDHADPNIKTIASALVDSAPDWIKMRDAVTKGDIPPGQDIISDLMNAVKVVMRQRDAGLPVWKGFMQSDAFQSDMSQLAARLFFKDDEMTNFYSKSAMADQLSSFANTLKSGVDRGEDMFGNKPPTVKEALEARIAKNDANVVALTRAAGDEKAVNFAFDDPKVHAAAEADLRRSIDQGRNIVPIEGENGTFKLGVADSEMLDIENQIKMADEVSACSTPQLEAAE